MDGWILRTWGYMAYADYDEVMSIRFSFSFSFFWGPVGAVCFGLLRDEWVNTWMVCRSLVQNARPKGDER